MRRPPLHSGEKTETTSFLSGVSDPHRTGGADDRSSHFARNTRQTDSAATATLLVSPRHFDCQFGGSCRRMARPQPARLRPHERPSRARAILTYQSILRPWAAAAVRHGARQLAARI